MEYTDGVKRVLKKWEAAAGQSTLELLAILAEKDCGYAAEILRRYGIEDAVLQIPFPHKNSAERERGYCREIAAYAEKIAEKMGCNRTDTHHLLASLCAFPKCDGAKYLKQKGVSAEELNGILESMSFYGVGEPKNGTPRAVKNTPERDLYRKITEQVSENDAGGLSEYGQDLTEAAKKGRLDPVIGRDREMNRLIEILCRKTKNNPVLIGEPGVGKTAVVEGLAQRIEAGEIQPLKGKRIFALDLGKLLAGARYRGDLEERLKIALEESRNDTVLFLDEMHMLLSAGDKEGGMTAANLLKPMLARGEISVIGATTAEEYRRYVEKDGALARRFQPIYLDPPDADRTLEMLKGLRESYEAHHRVVLTDEGLKAAIRLSERYLTERYLPDKAIDLMDETASKVRLRASMPSPEAREYEVKIEEIKRRTEDAVRREDYRGAMEYQQIGAELAQKLMELKGSQNRPLPVVGAKEVAKTLSEWTGIPMEELAETAVETLKDPKISLSERVFGQPQGIAAVAGAVRRARMGLSDPVRPIGVYLFAGPDGVGKRTLAKALAEDAFGGEKSLIRFDMSEYRDGNAVQRLIGAAPGYIGYAEGGRLTEEVRSHPHSVILFEKAELAHPDVFALLAQVIEAGILTDNRGKKAVFRNCILIFCTDMVTASTSERMGFTKELRQRDEATEQRIRGLEKRFPSEFLELMDEIVAFTPLKPSDLRRIAMREYEAEKDAWAKKGVAVTVTERAKEAMLREVCVDGNPARTAVAAVRNRIVYSVGEALAHTGSTDKKDVTVDFSNEKWTYDIN